jgi:ribosomal protein S19
MKIALINNLYAQQKRGGAEIVIEKLKHALEEEGHDCFLISTAPKGVIRKNNRTERDNKSHYLISSLYYNLNKLPYIIRLLWHLYKQVETKSVNKVKKIIKQEKPDLIISHNLIGFGIKIYELINKLNISHIHYLHDTQMLHPAGRIIYQQENIINSLWARLYQKTQIKYSNKADLILSPSKWLLKLHQDKGFFKDTKTWQKFNPLENIEIKNNIKVIDDIKTKLDKKINNIISIYNKYSITNLQVEIINFISENFFVNKSKAFKTVIPKLPRR